MRRRDQRKWNRGFTLVETLAAVAVLVILLGLGSVAVVYYRDYLRITELDNAAREIYMAAEHRAVLLSGSRRLGGLVEDGGTVLLSADVAEDGTDKAYYISSENLSAALLDTGSIDPALWDGHFYVVYEPVSGSVTDVFYAEEPIETLIDADFQTFYDEWTAASRMERMRARPMLGYYGGGMAEGDESSRLPTPDVTVLIHNEEKLTVEVTFSVPTSASAVPGLNTKREVELKYGGSPVSLLESGRLSSQETTFRDGKTVTTCIWVLDSLERGEGQFKDLFGGTGTYGGDFTVSASLRLSAAGYRPSQASDSDTDNSLFAEGSGGSTAGIRLLRHLQNLDSGFSGVAGKTAAEQNDRIYCAENETYPGYAFRPIENSELNAYNGGEMEIYGLLVTPESAGGRPAGLFSSVGNRENFFNDKNAFSFTDIRLVNAAVDAGAAGVAGALAGTAEYASFENCRVYWEATEDHSDLRELLGSDAEDDGYVYQIKGAVAGGLVGQLNYSYIKNTITNCFVATLAEGRDTTGGLVGTADGNLDIVHSYADCYLSGKNAAGLIGSLDASVYLTNCYAAGFIYAEEKAAGLCLGTEGKTNTENVYSAMCYPAAGGGGAAVYGLTEMQGDNNDYFENTFYLKTSGQIAGSEAWGRDYADMTDRTGTFRDDLGGAFDWKTARDTRPYNLREHLNLVNYSFPGLAALPHYGDWGAQFQEPSLVYFEEYKVKNPGEERYGFSGGNARYLTGIGKLDNERTILSDGYAVALLQSDLKDLPESGYVQVTYWNADGKYWDGAADGWASGGGAASAVCRKSDLTTAVWENEEGSKADYYLIPLPEKMVVAGVASKHFFQYLRFELNAEGIVPVSGEYFYNPHFAETVIPYVPEETEEGGAALVWNSAAADRYAGEELVEKGRRNTASVRTPRHLYNLSVYQEYCSNREHRYTFRQELHLDYGTYTGYGLFSAAFRQAPIGSWSEPFHGVYDGGCRRIRGVTFSVPENSERFYAGLFGYSAGTLRDIVYKMDPEQAVTVAMDNGSQSLYVGALAGGNAGTIQNCAVSGISLTGYSFGSTIYVGGLVGQNSGVIRSSAAESASLSADCSSYASAYVGGLAGRNDAAREITVSYAVGKITAVVDKNSSARICGFVGYNAGVIRDSYAAADLESTGQQVETYGFCGVRSGSQSGTYYLNEGNFTYREVSYAADYHRDDDRAAGIKYAALADNPFSGSGSEMKKAEARDEDEPGEDLFPYPTGVRNADNKPVHYGQWPALMDLGEMGAYYWEELEINGKSKFNISVLAVKPDEKTVAKRSSLSNAHDDGGVVTNYGYGYYTKEGASLTALDTTIYYSPDGGEGSQLAMDREPTEYEKGVNEVLAEQSKGVEGQNEEFVFHSYRTFGLEQEGGLYPHGASANSPNATLQLTQGSGTSTIQIEFTLNPLFADAMSVTLPDNSWSTENGAPVTAGAAPGSEKNVYGVRSVEQLQFINWNSDERNTSTVIESGTNVSRFPYLSNSDATGKYYWTQSHDIRGRENADGTKRYYTPIAEYYDVSTGKRGNLNGWFRGTYDGDDYVIENVNIKGQKSSCAGLFGIVYNGTLKNIVLFSGEVVSYKNENGQTGSCWYAIGGLAGLAATDGKSAIQNCSVAGYRIDADVRMQKSGGENWGGAEIGGLVGISFMDMEECAAETTIVLPGSIESVDNIRMGGLAGASQRTISNSYAGGEIQVGKLENQSNLGGSIYIGGLVGGSYFKPLQPSSGNKIGTEASDSQGNLNDTTNNALTNCYSYVVLPEAKADGYNKIQSLYALGGTGEINSAAEAGASWDNKANHGVCTITNCYYLGSETLKHNQSGISGIKTDLNNVQAVSVTHRQLAGQDAVIDGRTIYQRLNNFAGSDEAARENGPFRPVTSQIDGYDVAGKYSYPPGGRPELEGLDYPFPTILTQDSGANCVHYGAWPLNGIKRDSGGAPIALDLYTKQTHDETLALEGVPAGGQWSVESRDGNIASGTVTQAGRLEVTAVGEGTTKLTVKYVYGGVTYPLAITVNVTAYLELRPSTAAVFPGGRVELAMTPWGRTPVTAAGGGEYREQSPQGLRLASVGSSSDLIRAAVPGENESHVLLTVETGAPASEVPSIVSIGYTYTYKDTEQPHALAVTVLALPEAVWQDDTCTLDFSGGFGGHSVTVLSADLPEGTGVTANVKDNVITLEGVPAGQNAPELTVALTMDGLDHTVVMTPVRPPAAGN